ncbi:MAG TPA: ATP-binding protein [bacterium]|nr:ATP-binding protein [bacterium]HPO09476.1 ATP-binding protein [bacterium]HQP98007.1 ATP-binding protein [bacterium]
MKQITVISGKGGTGKTSFVAAFAGLAENAVLADCDVDAADLHLIFNPTVLETQEFMSGYQVRFDPEKCSACGECVPVCRFRAVTLHDDSLLPLFDPFACEGCGCCVDICPTGALILEDRKSGEMYVSDTRFGPMVHARLDVGESSSGKLVSMVRTRSREIAEQEHRDLILIDGSPGVGCPVIASLNGVDTALIVTEPTVSGLHDLQRVTELCRHFQIPTSVIVNKFDLNAEMASQIESYSDGQDMICLGRIAFDPLFVKSMAASKTVVEFAGQSKTAERLQAIWVKLVSEL